LKLPSLPVVETAGVEPAINQQGPLIPKNLARINLRFNPDKGRVCGVLRRESSKRMASCWLLSAFLGQGNALSIARLLARRGSLGSLVFGYILEGE